MFEYKRPVCAAAFVLLSLVAANACTVGSGGTAPNEHARRYAWTKATGAAAFPAGYNFPVFVARGSMWAFHHEGVWQSADGASWTKSSLPPIKSDAYRTRYIQFDDGVYALGDNRGDYLKGITFSSTIRRTTDFARWETLAEKSELPARVFHGALVHQGKLWLMGGYDGREYHNDVWNSADGVRWTRVTQHTAWTPRNAGAVVAFKDRMWMIGGGVIDGEPTTNPNSGREVWSSSDGVNWTRTRDNIPPVHGGSPVVFDGELWLVGANRDGTFARSSLVTADGETWREEAAPWSPRGAVATWVVGGKLYMTGGKYSVTQDDEIKFIYSNDVWFMSAQQRASSPRDEECEWCGGTDAPPNVSAKAVIPPANEPGEPLVISGTVYKEDGTTPATGALIYAYHTNAAGLYPKRTPNDGRAQWRHGYLRGWVRTGADGRYEFRTIRPATYPTRDEPAHIHLTITTANSPEYSATLWFAGDSLITPELRRKDAATVPTRTMRPAAIITLERTGGVLRGTHDIRLERIAR